MKLSALSGESHAPDPDIAGVTSDSRVVAPGFLFAALPGEKIDGVKFIPQAEEKGAAAILARPGAPTRLPLIADTDPRGRLANIAARFYPRQPEIVAGLTGTNGKTSTAHFAAELWSMLGRNSGSLGTLGARAGGIEIATGLTTPEPVKLHAVLDDLSRRGVDRLAMEVSSHAIAQSRADAVKFSIAGFTNITRDHLDYHSGFDGYFDAKKKLFDTLLCDTGVVVVNADGEGASEIVNIAHARGLRVMSTGATGGDIRFLNARPYAAGINLSVLCEGEEYSISLPLIGLFQAENALLAAGIVIASGEPAGEVILLLEKLSGVPGRMQFAADVNNAGIYIDYAHTPDAIATALASIRPHASGRVIAIIGAGGDRDKEKRPLMGKAAHENANVVIVTDDNPRTEEPSIIRREVLQGAPGAREIGDRRTAIAQGVAMLEPGDVLLMMGKGHETGQQVGEKLLAFNDVEAAIAAAEKRRGLIGR